ncbi:hypothetical protein EU546_06165 [Candidatus Thorarchaeota archaeon]|nr:MAG: hypothetical protein EU546_06165 [Candidatus Thorarchaeota archaeon]
MTFASDTLPTVKKVFLVFLLVLFISSGMIGEDSVPSILEEDQHQIHYRGIPASSSTEKWHHDCSNLTAFDGRGDDSWPHNTGVSVTFGSIQTSDGYFYSDDVGTGSGHHGPLYYHTLEQPLVVGEFVSLRTEMEINATAADRRAWLRVGLHAPDNSTIMTFQLADPWVGVNAAYAIGIYKFENDSNAQTPGSYPDYASDGPVHESFAILQNASGLFTALPQMTNSCILDASQIERGRQIKFISIQFNGYDTGILSETMRIHDIELTWNRTTPAINHPSNIRYSEGSWGNIIEWKPFSDNPSTYEILRNGTPIMSGAWNSSTETISVSVDGLNCAAYNYTAVVKDTLGDSISDEVWVTVTDDTPPELNSPPDMQYESGSTGNVILWLCSDLHPSHYVIRLNGSSTGAFQWDGSNIEYSIDGLPLGLTNVTILLYDDSQNSAADTVWVTVEDTTNPAIDSPADVTYAEGNTSVSLQWNPTDLNPSSYEVLRNGNPMESGMWDVEANPIEVQVGNWTLGNYNVTITVFDRSDNRVVDSVWISVIDGTAPTVDSPSDVEYTEGDTGNSVTWHPVDAHPVSYEILLDSEVITMGSWNSSSENISISVDGYAVGTYNLTLVLTDVGSNTATDSVSIVVTPFETTTTTTTTGSTTTTTTPDQPGVPLTGIIAILVGIFGVGLVALLCFARRR